MKKIEVTINKIFMRSILMILVFLTLSFSCSKSDSIDNSGNNSNDSSNDNSNNNESGERTTYYISSSSGNDNNQGSENSPWNSISKISNIELSPGDSIFFKKGDTFVGQFKVNGSGSEDKPIVITSYGSSNDKPIISGSGDNISGVLKFLVKTGQTKQCVLL